MSKNQNSKRARFVVGNWKMNKSLQDVESFFKEILPLSLPTELHAWVAPQAIHLCHSSEMTQDSPLKVVSQDCGPTLSGAFTGEVSPEALIQERVTATLVGHSERRAIGESSALLAQKVRAAQKAGLSVIYCLGETLQEREEKRTLSVLEHQVRSVLDASVDPQKLILAYEPVWAIGTGKNASPDDAEEALAYLRGLLTEVVTNGCDVPLLYGGSVKPSNFQDLLQCPSLDGGLVGGASLDAQDFRSLIEIAAR